LRPHDNARADLAARQHSIAADFNAIAAADQPHIEVAFDIEVGNRQAARFRPGWNVE
jgi:hypothetical protein